MFSSDFLVFLFFLNILLNMFRLCFFEMSGFFVAFFSNCNRFFFLI